MPVQCVAEAPAPKALDLPAFVPIIKRDIARCVFAQRRHHGRYR
jgi:hypothetical protein